MLVVAALRSAERSSSLPKPLSVSSSKLPHLPTWPALDAQGREVLRQASDLQVLLALDSV